ncbi:MAG: DUF11 domain-containing protein, partial [Desulfuromonadales bacterium]|nr:DUF11 domain-containing protein [Desulfuromonadales bacterium]
ELTARADQKGVYPVFAEIIEQEGDDIDSTPDNFDPLLSEMTREDDTGAIELYVDAEPVIGMAKRVVRQEGDLSGFTATFELIVSNLGNTPLTGVQIVDPLPAIFEGTEYQVTHVEVVSPLVANSSFDGKNEVNLLDAGQSRLGVSDQATVRYTVEVTPVSRFG